MNTVALDAEGNAPVAEWLRAHREADEALDRAVAAQPGDDAFLRACQRAFEGTYRGMVHHATEFRCVVTEARRDAPVSPVASVCYIYQPDPEPGSNLEVRVYVHGDEKHPLVAEVVQIAAFWKYCGDWDRGLKRIVRPRD